MSTFEKIKTQLKSYYLKRWLLGCFLGCQCLIYPQHSTKNTASPFFWQPEFGVGLLSEPNTGFPDTDLQTSLSLSLGWFNSGSDKEWAKRLNFPKTGVFAGFYNLGNRDQVGHAYVLMPFMEFQLSRDFHLNSGMGVSYVDRKHDPITNPMNRGISTDINWSYRAFLYYDIHRSQTVDWRLGAGYVHQSNGHTRLPNQGLNSFLISAAAFIASEKPAEIEQAEVTKESSRQTYLSFRTGIGQNVLSEVINDKREVYAAALSFGTVLHKTFKFGGGVYYRFYEHYYDYIQSGGEVVVEEYPIYQENPFGYASAFGVFGTAELLLSHVGFEFDLGFNIYKPAYKIDWILNEGVRYENEQGETVQLPGELDWYYEIKRTVMARMGLKYYLISNDKAPRHNVFVGAHINANLGQADFTELSIGYVYRWSKN